MPLRMKCGHCGRELVLEDVFRGTYCRCRHCRRLLQVPAMSDGRAMRAAVVRPESPALLSACRQFAPTPSVQRVSPSQKKTSVLNRLASHTLLVSLLSVLAVGASVTAWYKASPARRINPALVSNESFQTAANAQEEPVRPSDDPVQALATADPLKTYFGFPLDGETIGYVVDGDVAMAPYIEQVALATNAVNASLDRTRHRFGVVLAANIDGHQITEIAEPTADLPYARSVLTSRLPGGQTDLARALGRASDWYASRLFLVLAKPIDDQQLAILTEAAEQTGAKVNVIALGDASRQDLSSIAEATGGRYLPLSKDQLADWSAKVLKAQEAPVAAPSTN